MFEFSTYWDVLEFKIIVIGITVFLGVLLGNYLHKKIKDVK